MDFLSLLSMILTGATFVTAFMVLHIVFNKGKFKLALAIMFLRYKLVRLATITYSIGLLIAFFAEILFIFFGKKYLLVNMFVYNIIYIFLLIGFVFLYSSMRMKKDVIEGG